MSLTTDLVDAQCVYCGEPISLVIDAGTLQDEFSEQHYVEDCQVCCRPLHLSVSWQQDDGGVLEPSVAIRAEDEC